MAGTAGRSEKGREPNGDQPAVNLYESLGTREDVYHFDFLVDG